MVLVEKTESIIKIAPVEVDRKTLIFFFFIRIYFTKNTKFTGLHHREHGNT